MKKYLLNSAVITSPGVYRYEFIDAERAKAWLAQGNWESYIGYEETVKALSLITGVHIPMNRGVIKMQPGDQALVFRLTFPQGADRVAPSSKGELGVQFVLEHCEIGLLTMLIGANDLEFLDLPEYVIRALRGHGIRSVDELKAFVRRKHSLHQIPGLGKKGIRYIYHALAKCTTSS